MKRIVVLIVFMLAMQSAAVAQILYQENFHTGLSSCTPSNSSFGAWVWSNSCGQSTVGAHTTPGTAIFQGTGCQFGNGVNTVSGNLLTPTIAVTGSVCMLSFKYALWTECDGGLSATETGSLGIPCAYEVLSLNISTNGGASFVPLLSSNGSPGGLSSTYGWVNCKYLLSAYANQTIMLQFGFNSIDGISNNFDGVYIDDIIVESCTVTPGGSIFTSSVAPSLCSGNSLTLSASGGSNYQWSTGAVTSSIVVSPTVTTTYSLQMGSGAICSASAQATVTVDNSPPSITLPSAGTMVCPGASVTFSATGSPSLTWSGGISNGVPFVPNGTGSYTVTGLNACGSSSAVAHVTVTPLTVSISAPAGICAGQGLQLNIQSPATDFTCMPGNLASNAPSFSLNPSASTTYTILAMKGVCSASATALVQVAPIPTLTAFPVTAQVCLGSSVSFTASGASNYTWLPSNVNTPIMTDQPVANAAYTVIGSNAAGCEVTQVVVAVTKSSPVVSIVSPGEICIGESVTLTASGAMSYTWNTLSTQTIITDAPVSTTVYAVTGYSNGCSTTQTMQVVVHQPAVSITGNTQLCTGMTTTLTASGANSYTWLPSHSFPSLHVSPQANTIYSLTAESMMGNLLCTVTKTVHVTVSPTPVITTSLNRTTICKGESLNILAGGALTYKWNTGATTQGIVVTGSASATMNFTVWGTNAGGCSSSTVATIRVLACTGVEEIKVSPVQFSAYPNPSYGAINVCSTGETAATLYNDAGQMITALSLTRENNFTAEISGLAAGTYVLSSDKFRIKVIVLN